MKDSGGRCLFEFVVDHIVLIMLIMQPVTGLGDKLELRIILLKLP